MNFNRCERCGCFFVTNSDVCPKCETKDTFEMKVLKNYLSNNSSLDSIDDISSNTGISKKNLNRFMQYDEFSNYMDNKNTDLKMNL